MDTEIDQNLEQITREYVDFLDDMVDILIIDTCQQCFYFIPAICFNFINFI